MGLSQVKNGLSFVWLSECTSTTYKPRGFTVINMFDALTMAVVGLYFIFISKEWFWLYFIMLLLTYITTALVVFCPESPRWHLINGRSAEAIAQLNLIGKLNGFVDDQIPPNAVFVEDPTNYLNFQEQLQLNEANESYQQQTRLNKT